MPLKHHVDFEELLELPVGRPDEILKYGNESEHQFAELWLPSRNTKVPVVMLIHGGCWQSSFDLSHVRPMCAAIKALGIAVWSIEYRRIGDQGGGWPGTFSDALSGLKLLDELNRAEIDYDRKILMGHSAGGHLALWVAAAFGEEHPFRDRKVASINTIIGLAAISDLETYAAGSSFCNEAARQLLRGLPADQPDLYRWASPIRLGVHNNTVLIHGDVDQIVPVSQSENFAGKKGVKLRKLPETGHFDLIHPGSAAWRQVALELTTELSV